MRMTEITNPDGTKSVAYEFSDMEEYRAYKMMEATGFLVVAPQPVGQLGEMFRSNMTAPVIPEIVGAGIDDEAEADDNEEDLECFHEDAVSGTRKRKVRHIPQNPPPPPGRWPDIFYITPECWEVVELLREHPVGLTSNQVEEALKLNRTVGSGRLNTLMTTTPLVEKMGTIYRLSIIGRDKTLKLDLSKLRPSPTNKGLGWDRFMAEPLPDGKQVNRRKRRPA